MIGITGGKVPAACCCLLGLLACWLMWHEAGLPPKDRPLRLFGAGGGKGIASEIYPESALIFSCGICVMTLLGIIGLVGREGRSPVWHWGPAFVMVGVLLLLFMHQARSVNGVGMEIVQPGYVLGLLAGTGLLVSGGIVFVSAWRAACRTNHHSGPP